jgi:hypothetical protein
MSIGDHLLTTGETAQPVTPCATIHIRLAEYTSEEVASKGRSYVNGPPVLTTSSLLVDCPISSLPL